MIQIKSRKIRRGLLKPGDYYKFKRQIYAVRNAHFPDLCMNTLLGIGSSLEDNTIVTIVNIEIREI